MVAKSNNDKVTLYYLGGLQDRKDPSKNVIVTAGQRAFTLPYPGESLQVERRFADELEKKHKYSMPDGEYVSCFTTDRRLAQRIRDGYSPIEARTGMEVERLSDADFAAEAKRRGLIVEEKPAAKKPVVPPPDPIHVEAAVEVDDDDEVETTLGTMDDDLIHLMTDKHTTGTPTNPSEKSKSRPTKKDGN